MSCRDCEAGAGGPARDPARDPARNPARDPGGAVRFRRAAVAAATLAGIAVLAAAMASLLAPGGWHLVEILIVAAYALSLPWTMLGFWNALIGFVLERLVRDPVAHVFPALRRVGADDPLTARTAVALCIRHEDPDRVLRRVEAMLRSLEAAGLGHAFDFHILSDSSRPDVAAAEEAAFAALKERWPEPGRLAYRRRRENAGYKAGNLREFVDRAAGRYDFAIVLDADSLMAGAAMARLVRVMQADPRLGIVQHLTAGLPSGSAFARISQWGMRQGMRTHTIGAAWWQGDAGPFWGHNAILRLAPFAEHCRLPPVPGRPPLGGAVLSHDQVEAALMRRAGYEVRVLADETGSWEENPPSLPDHVGRDLRWCLGNMQYTRLLPVLPLHPMGRFQLVNAVWMYLGAPLWVVMLLSWLSLPLLPGGPGSGVAAVDLPRAAVLLAATLGIGMAPRLLGVLGILADAGRRACYGGTARILAGWAAETVFSWLLGPLMLIAEAAFLATLPLGRHTAWKAQNRDGHGLTVRAAAAGLWPQMAFGAAWGGLLAWLFPAALPWAAPLLASCALAIPFACLTADPRFGALLERAALCAIPEEFSPPPEIAGLRTEAVMPATGLAPTRNAEATT